MGLPDLTLRLSHANTFDDQREVQDTTTNMVTLGSRYAYKSLNFGYMFTGTDATDHLHGTDSTTLLHNGSVSYSDQFFNQRVSLYSHYNVNYLESTTKAGNGGDVDTPLFPVSGLSAFTIDPSVGTVDQNVAEPRGDRRQPDLDLPESISASSHLSSIRTTSGVSGSTS